MEAVIFFVCAAVAVVGALGVVLARNPVHSALFLLLTLVTVAVLFLSSTPRSSRPSRSSCTRARSSCCSCS